jgi:nicotinic acid mononucleotide adenylyltransferase
MTWQSSRLGPFAITIACMDEALRQFIQAIHDSPPRAVFAAAGAGSRALADLLAVPGASRTLLEALIPYAADSFDEFLGQTPEQYVSAETGRKMAGRALARAHHLRELETFPVAGLGCTATIVTDRPKRGDHRAHIAAWTPARLAVWSLVLEKGARDRAGEEGLVSRLILDALGDLCGVDGRPPLPIGSGDTLSSETIDYLAVAGHLARGNIDWFGIQPDGQIRPDGNTPAAILSGSFNPLHGGHTTMAGTASAMLGRAVAFEVSAVNVDKPPLEPNLVLERLSQFAGRYDAIAGNAPTFVEKSRLYPEAVFVVGFDTAARVIQPRYYGHSEAAMQAALTEMRDRGNRFLVAGREDEDGRFWELRDLKIPDGFEGLFAAIPAQLFRNDISSTEIRGALQREAESEG